MSSFIQNLQQVEEDEYIPYELECMPGVTVSIKPLSHRDIERVRKSATKRNKFRVLEYERLLTVEAVKGWIGMTQGKAMDLLGGSYNPPPDYDPEKEIPYSAAEKNALARKSHSFRREIGNLIEDEGQLTEARKEAASQEAEVKKLIRFCRRWFGRVRVTEKERDRIGKSNPEQLKRIEEREKAILDLLWLSNREAFDLHRFYGPSFASSMAGSNIFGAGANFLTIRACDVLAVFIIAAVNEEHYAITLRKLNVIIAEHNRSESAQEPPERDAG